MQFFLVTKCSLAGRCNKLFAGNSRTFVSGMALIFEAGAALPAFFRVCDGTAMR